MKPIPFIRAAVALEVASLLTESGARADRAWTRAGLPGSPLVDPEALLPMHAALAFTEQVARDQGCEDLGLRVARRSGLAAAGQFGRGMLRAATLYEAVSFACRNVAAHNSGARYWLVQEGDSVRVCRRFRSRDRDFWQADALTVALMIDLVRRVAGPGWLPARVEMQSVGSLGVGERAGIDSLVLEEVATGRAATSIVIPRRLLALPLAAGGARSHPGDPTAGWLAGAPPTDFVASVELVIESSLRSERADVAVAAGAAGISTRSFQRRLAEIGASYSDLVDRVRYRKAVRWLHDDGVKIIDVAFALGYSDPAHFTRAFRRWTSLTPLEFRQIACQSDDRWSPRRSTGAPVRDGGERGRQADGGVLS